MKFQGKQKTLSYTQINQGNIDEVFPLLCPVREKEWLDGWSYRMIHSKSGVIEKDCVFATPHHGEFETIWQVTQYDREKHRIEFVRLTPGENIVKINIHLEPIDKKETRVHISYQYTGLSEQQNLLIERGLENSFQEDMQWWEKAINHFLQRGEMLKRE